ncbi:MAG: hypothetical protein IJD04_03590 [Desulfovibrionaceae bacterium]|nr:hypothetical protein [Desulfovibrionaceae bacterium]
MPVPSPKHREPKEKFIFRCMQSITDKEKAHFSSQAQVAAVCYSEWDRHLHDQFDA